MKTLALSFLLVSFFSCNQKPMEDPAKTTINPDFAKKHAVTLKQGSKKNAFVKTNDSCICTKEYSPVCGSDERNYPSSCQAGCAGITEFTPGRCK